MTEVVAAGLLVTRVVVGVVVRPAAAHQVVGPREVVVQVVAAGLVAVAETAAATPDLAEIFVMGPLVSAPNILLAEILRTAAAEIAQTVQALIVSAPSSIQNGTSGA